MERGQKIKKSGYLFIIMVVEGLTVETLDTSKQKLYL